MAKGYWIPQIDVSNPEGYKAYMAATPPAHEKYHGVALVRGGRMEVVEGRARGRCVLREFPDYAGALACYRSEDYQRARLLRLRHSQCDFTIVEGYDGAQPPSSSPPPPASKKATGSPWSMWRTQQATSPIPLPIRRRLANLARAIWCAPASKRSLRAGRAAASSSWNFRATKPRSLVIAHQPIRRRRNSATVKPRPISLSSKVTTARNSKNDPTVRSDRLK
jgi:uncharacterized protein (DUF1330 family)